MARRYSTADFAHLVERVRARLPDIAITADIIAGFPGETDDDHADSLSFVHRMAFADAHVFRYSPRKGTAASRMASQIKPEIKKERSEALRAAAHESALEFRKRFVGSVRPVLWEEEITTPNEEAGAPRRWSGLTDNYLRVVTSCDRELLGTISSVSIASLNGSELVGRLHELGRQEVACG